VVTVCSGCDCGQSYCSQECAREARRKQKLAAALAYQRTFKGKRKHAAREMRYRQRQIEKVTRQCRDLQSPGGKVRAVDYEAIAQAVEVALGQRSAVCRFCGKKQHGPGRKGYVGCANVGPFERQNRKYWWLAPD